MNQPYDAAAPSPESHLTGDDISQLDALAIAHYVLGGLGMFFSLFALLYVFGGVMILTNSVEAQEVPPAMGALLIGFGLIAFILGEAMSIALILSGRHLKRRTGYMFSFVLACIACINVPIGTILGIFTIIVLNRDSVKAAYGRH